LLSYDSGCTATVPDLTALVTDASDNCSSAPVLTQSIATGTEISGEVTVTITATDQAGNSSSCDVLLNASDQTSPTALCKDITVYLDMTGEVTINAEDIDNGSTDNCGLSNIEIDKTEFDCSHLGVNTVTLTAIDDAGNTSTCTATVTVLDNIDPVLDCPAPVVLSADANCEAAVPDFTGAESTNNCGTATITQVPAAGTLVGAGVTTVTVTATDASGNSSSCTTTVTVIDDTAPMIQCQPAVELTALPGECLAQSELISPLFSDNCFLEPKRISFRIFNPDNSVSDWFNFDNSLATFSAGTSRVEWIAEDSWGNITNCWQNVLVVPDEESLKPDAGPDLSICEYDTARLDDALVSDFAEIHWSSSGTGHFIEDSVQNPVYIPSAADRMNGFVLLTVHVSIDCAEATDKMVLSVRKPPLVSAGSDAVICENEFYQLSGTVVNEVAGVEWTTTGTGTFSNPNSANPVYVPGEEDIEQGLVQLIFRGISGSTCSDVTDTLLLQVERQPVLDAGEDLWTCENEEIHISGATTQYLNGEVSWSTSGTGTFDNSNSVNPVYIPSEADIINGSVVLTIRHNPEGPCVLASDKFVLAISKRPEGDAGPPVSTCFGQPVIIQNAFANHFSEVSWTTNGPGVLENANSIWPTYIPAENEIGTVQLFMQIIGQNACSNDTIFSETELVVFDQLLADAGGDDTIFASSSAILSVDVQNGSGSYFYNWEPSYEVVDPNVRSTRTVNLNSNSAFQVTVTDASTGCIATDVKTIYVEESSDGLLGFYNALSPNNDGVNDAWIIEGIEKFPENEVLIFNRWGDKIKHLINYDNDRVVWDGTNNRDKKVPDGTYYYIVRLKDIKAYTGWIHLRSER
jgi:gliding motility-associated-like protein